MNLFKQPKHASELMLSNFKIIMNCWRFICLPDHNNQPTASTTGSIISIISHVTVCFHPNKAFYVLCS